MSNSIPLRYDYMSHLPFFPAEGSKGCEIEEIRDPRDGYTHAKGQQIFTDLESSGHGKKDVGTLVSYRQDEGKTFPCKNEGNCYLTRPVVRDRGEKWCKKRWASSNSNCLLTVILRERQLSRELAS